jgi:hypothetical protein
MSQIACQQVMAWDGDVAARLTGTVRVLGIREPPVVARTDSSPRTSLGALRDLSQ